MGKRKLFVTLPAFIEAVNSGSSSEKELNQALLCLNVTRMNVLGADRDERVQRLISQAWEDNQIVCLPFHGSSITAADMETLLGWQGLKATKRIALGKEGCTVENARRWVQEQGFEDQIEVIG